MVVSDKVADARSVPDVRLVSEQFCVSLVHLERRAIPRPGEIGVVRDELVLCFAVWSEVRHSRLHPLGELLAFFPSDEGPYAAQFPLLLFGDEVDWFPPHTDEGAGA